MLVLSRKKNETVRISDDITIVIIEIRGDKVRLGIEAPPGTPVHRGEVYEAIRRKLPEGAPMISLSAPVPTAAPAPT